MNAKVAEKTRDAQEGRPAPASARKLRVWEDAEDAAKEGVTPAFLRSSHVTPSWAVPESSTAPHEPTSGAGTGNIAGVQAATRKRFRSADLDALLARTEPLLTARQGDPHACTPTVLSVLPLPRDTGRTVHWHRNGQLALVGGNHHVYAFHAAGRFVEQLFKIDVRQRIAHTVLGATGEQLVVAGQQSYTPLLLTLATEQLTPLTFLDTRDTAVYRNHRRDTDKTQRFLSALAVPQRVGGGGAGVVAVGSGCTVRLGSLNSGTIVGELAVTDPVRALCFADTTELFVASGRKLHLYDLRHTARVVRTIEDEGALQVTALDVRGRGLAVGSSSGVVNVYDRHDGAGEGAVASGAARPVRTLKNLTTAVGAVCFGQDSAGAEVLAFCSGGQKAAFRLALMPDCRVVPGFPAVALRHGFVQSLAIAPTVPILSVGERQKVTNYAL